MRESRLYGSVRGALSNERPYRDRCASNDGQCAMPDSAILSARHHRPEQVPAFALELHHLKLLQRRKIGRAGLDLGARQIDADLEIQVGRLLHDVLAGEIVL